MDVRMLARANQQQSLSSTPRIFTRRRRLLAALAVVASVVTSHGQTKSVPPAHTAALLVDTDDPCRLALDGVDQGVLTPDQAKRLEVPFGEHVLKCSIEAVPDLVWRKVIEVKSSDQVAALVALKALHIQYNQAIVQRNQAAAAQEKHQSDVAVAEQNRAAVKKGPTLQDALLFVQSSLNSMGTVSKSWSAPNLFTGGLVHLSTSTTMSDVSGDAEHCTLAWKATYFFSSDKGYGTSSMTLHLTQVSDVRVMRQSERDQQADIPIDARQQLASFRYSPEPFVVVITTTQPQAYHFQTYKKPGKLEKEGEKSAPDAEITFSDVQLATRVGKAIRYASGLCGGGSQSTSEF